MSGWTCWKDIKQYSGCKCSYVYKIRLAKNGSPKEIPRFLCKDKSGLTYIGESSTKTSDRLMRFKNLIMGKRDEHSAAKRYLDVKSKKHRLCKYQIQYSYKIVCNECEAKKEEKRLLEKYYSKHGELPPLNQVSG